MVSLKSGWSWMVRRWQNGVLPANDPAAEAPAQAVAEEAPEALMPPDDLPGEARALFRPTEGGNVRVVVESFEARPRTGEEAKLRVRVTNVGRQETLFSQLRLYWYDDATCEGVAIARQRALALPGLPPGGMAVFETRLVVPLTVEGEVVVLVEPADERGMPWTPQGSRLVLWRCVPAREPVLEAA